MAILPLLGAVGSIRYLVDLRTRVSRGSTHSGTFHEAPTMLFRARIAPLRARHLRVAQIYNERRTSHYSATPLLRPWEVLGSCVRRG